jgi:hypothetical protein
MNKQIKSELRKARLPTGETLWVKLEGDFARIDNIPVSTNEYAYGDLVLLTIALDGMYEIADRIKWGGYTTALLKASDLTPGTGHFKTEVPLHGCGCCFW